MEEVETSECRHFYRCYSEPPAICLRVDAEWNPYGVRQQKSERKPGWLGEAFLHTRRSTNVIFSSCWTWQKASTIFMRTTHRMET